MKQLNYPIDKLDIKLIIEEDDNETLQSLENLKLESPFHIVKVPYSLPRTKAKACNYALPMVRGKYIGIYDAEDVPDPNQLKKVIAKFSTLPHEVVCIQAKLNYFNRNENVLTKLFSLEYLVWFDFILPALQYLNIPIPLGGTSNHFIASKLRELGGWDQYNVTEDADLGIRIARAGYKTYVIESLTLEEAPINVSIWFNQRSRWIKGYMQTYIVHMRNPITLYKELGFISYLGIQFFLGVFTLSFILNPFAIIGWIIFMITDIKWLFIPIIITYLWKTNLVVSLVNMIKFKIAAKYIDINIFCIMLFPIYFLMISAASFKSLWQLIFKPYYWDKTIHGLTKYKRINIKIYDKYFLK
ncbi:MAG: glycosyltransferase family 2 protein [Alphaproteobacteria bacterium]